MKNFIARLFYFDSSHLPFRTERSRGFSFWPLPSFAKSLLLTTCLWLLNGGETVLAKNTSLFAGKKSPGSIAVGVAEGNYTIEGKTTSLYSGHTDPGNHVTNRGFCSWNRAADISVAEADQRCLKSLQEHSQKIVQQMEDLGLEARAHQRAVVNGADIWNQSNSAGPEFVGQYQAALELGLQGKAAYVWARVEAFRTSEGALDASGLFGICRSQSYYQERLQGLRQDSELWRWQCIGLDQRRRVEVISETLNHHLGKPKTPSLPAVQDSTPTVAAEILDFSPASGEEVAAKPPQVLDFAGAEVEEREKSRILSFQPSYATTTTQTQSPAPIKLQTVTAEKSWSKELQQTLSVGEKVGNYRVTSGFGKRVHPVTKQNHFHGGVDLDTPTGTPVYAIGKSGSSTEIRCWYDGNGGGLVATMTSPSVPHLRFDLLHLSWCVTKTNGPRAQVEPGKMVARVGNSGRSTGPHLHFQMRDIASGKKKSPTKGYLLWTLQGQEPK